MAIAFVAQNTFETAVGTGTETKTLPGTPATNDIVLICIAADSYTSTSGVQGQGYTNIVGPTGTTPGHQICFKRMGSTPDTTVVVTRETGGTKKAAGLIQVWSGVDTTTAQDATATVATGLSANPNSPSITTVTDGARVFSVALLDDDESSGSVTYPSGYGNTLARDTNGAVSGDGATVAIASINKATAGAEDPGAYTITSDEWRAVTIALRPAANGAAQNKMKWIIGGQVGGPSGTNLRPGVIG